MAAIFDFFFLNAIFNLGFLNVCLWFYRILEAKPTSQSQGIPWCWLEDGTGDSSHSEQGAILNLEVQRMEIYMISKQNFMSFFFLNG